MDRDDKMPIKFREGNSLLRLVFGFEGSDCLLGSAFIGQDINRTMPAIILI